MDFISSMFLLYVTEALVIGAAGVIFRGDDEEEALTNVAETIFRTATAGIPLVREAARAIQGFPGGGPVGAVASDIGQFTKQVQQGEADPALFRSVVRLLADFGAPLPASQLGKASRALEEDGEFIDYLFGPVN